MQALTPESVLSVFVGIALAAAAGFRIFVPLLVVSVAARSGWLTLAPGFEWLGTTPATMVFATATVLEIAAYYVPFFDNLLDSVATPAAVIAGMVVSASVLTGLPPWLRYSVALIAAGGAAGLVQTSTALLRLKSSAMTAGFGNVVLATAELAGSVVLALVPVFFPFLAFLFVVIVLTFALAPLARRAMRHRHAVAR